MSRRRKGGTSTDTRETLPERGTLRPGGTARARTA